MNDKKEPAFFEFTAPNTDLNDLEFTSDEKTPEFEPKTNSVDNAEIFNFEPPETIPEFNINKTFCDTPDLTTIEKNLADEFIKNTLNNPDFKIPENQEIFNTATTELENKINSVPKQPIKTSFLKKFNFKNMFQNK